MSADIVAKLNKAVNETMGAKSMEANLRATDWTASLAARADSGAQLASESARRGAPTSRSATSRRSSDSLSRKPHPIWAEMSIQPKVGL